MYENNIKPTALQQLMAHFDHKEAKTKKRQSGWNLEKSARRRRNRRKVRNRMAASSRRMNR